MPEKTKVKTAALAFLITLAVAIAAIMVELIRSISLSMTSGVGLSADSFDQRFVVIMTAGLTAIFILVYFLIRATTISKERRSKH